MEEKKSLNGLTLQFDKWTSICWSNDWGYNEIFLKATANYLNNLLHVRKYLSPERLLDQLGMSWDVDALERMAFLRYREGYELKIKILSPDTMEMYAPMTIMISYEREEKQG